MRLSPGRTMVTLDDIRQAREATRSFIRHTPFDRSFELSRLTGSEVFLKLENFQVTGSFKPRGPANKLQSFSADQKRRGAVAATAGNHGLGLSYAGQRLGVPVHVHIPRSADADKLERLRQQETTLHFADSFEEAHFNALRMAESDGLTLVSAYSDPLVIASDGVIGLEMSDDQPGLDLVIVPVGGGGLAGGISLALTSLYPSIEVWGIEAARSPSFNTWFRAGHTGPVSLEDSIAEGLAGYIEPETLTWPYIKAHVREMRTVSDEGLVDAMRFMVRHHRMIVEPSGAGAVAAALSAGAELRGRRVGLVVPGGNVAWDRFRGLID
ncbi:MAG: pyridoxal-phosphate dependent enzyme [Gemmatimonadota bacterium]